MQIFDIPANELELFEKILVNYYKFYKSMTEAEAIDSAKEGVKNLVFGLDLNKSPLPENLEYFDEALSKVTENFYTPSTRQRFRFKRVGLETESKVKKRKKINNPITAEGYPDDQTKFENIKKNLLTEYPFLDRIDLQDAVNNYCLLIVRVNKMLESGDESSNMSIKNLTETQIKLGQYLGIAEGDRQKMKLAADKDNVASLSLQFQQTLDEYPDIMQKFKYQELKVLLHKYDRLELSRELFELSSFAGMSVENARSFCREREK